MGVCKENNKNSNMSLSDLVSSNIKAKLIERERDNSEYKIFLNKKIANKIENALRDNDSKKFLDD